MKAYLFLALNFIFLFNINAQEIEYPKTRVANSADTFYGEVIADPYRWLENTNSPEVVDWYQKQNALTRKALNKIQAKQDHKNRIDKYSYVDFNTHQKIGKYYYTRIRYSNHGEGSIAYKTRENGPYNLLVDPNYIDKNDRINIQEIRPSPDSEFLAFTYNRNGSDWREVQIVEIKSKTILSDHLTDVKFSNLEWKGNGFYYSKYARSEKYGPISKEEIYFHSLGDDQSQDSLVFRRVNPAISFNYMVTNDQQYLIIEENNAETDKKTIYLQYFNNETPRLIPLFRNIEKKLSILGNEGNKLFALTNYNSEYDRVVEIDLSNPNQWKEISHLFSDATLLDVRFFNNRIISYYFSKFQTIMVIQDFTGKVLHTHTFPLGTTPTTMFGSYDDLEISFSLSGYLIPVVGMKLNLQTFKQSIVQQTTVGYGYDKIHTEVKEFEMSDGAKVPVLLIYEGQLELDGKRPLLLSSYGGFGTITKPSFNAGLIFHIKEGGVFAFAAIRGGGEKGNKWHKAGKGDRKLRSIQDFIEVSETLINEGYTSSEYLGTTGGSNGGLVVASAAILRPDLYKVVVPVASPNDMIRVEKFTVGKLHTQEYGSVTSKEGFENLKQYSPLYNIKTDVNYPAMLIVTGDNDDRVPPFHSYKFAAALQNRSAQKNPIFLEVGNDQGHKGQEALLEKIQEKSDIYGFIMGMINNIKYY